MSFLHSNDDKGNTASFMNNRIPRKKTLTYSGSKSTVDTVSNTAKQPAVATDTLSVRIPRKSKDGAPSNHKKRTHDMSTSIATTKTTKKVKSTATTQANNNNTSVPINDNIAPTYQIVKEGRVTGYPIIVSQVGSEHDAILLGCKENPLEYLDNNKDGKVKIRWKFAGYNGLVPTNTVRLIKLVDGAPPIRKAAIVSGLLETAGGPLMTNDEGSSRSAVNLSPALHPVDINNVATTQLNQSPIPVPSVCISSNHVDNAYDQDTDDEDDTKPSPVPSSCISGNLGGYDLDTDNEEEPGKTEVQTVSPSCSEIKLNKDGNSLKCGGCSEAELKQKKPEVKVTAVQFPSKIPAAERSSNVATALRQKHTTQVFDHKLGASKKRLRRPIPNKIDLIPLKKVETILVDGKVPGPSRYAYVKWKDGNNDADTSSLNSNEIAIDISGFTEINITDIKKENTVVVDATTGNFVAGMITRDNAKQAIGGKKKYPKIRSKIALLQATTPIIERGKERNSINTSYHVRGTRKNPSDNEVGEYVFKPGTSEQDKQTVNNGVRTLVHDMESGGRRILQVLPETYHFQEVRRILDLESVGGDDSSIATQFEIGENYWSKYHTNDDQFFCTLSCMCKDKKDNEKVMYYLVFPEYQLKIPMKPGDVIVFNPLQLHSCSNCRIKDSHIFSAFVSKKTCMTKGMMLGLDKRT